RAKELSRTHQFRATHLGNRLPLAGPQERPRQEFPGVRAAKGSFRTLARPFPTGRRGFLISGLFKCTRANLGTEQILEKRGRCHRFSYRKRTPIAMDRRLLTVSQPNYPPH